MNTKSGLTVGKLINILDTDGIAMLRLANLEKNNMVLMDDNNNCVPIRVSVPKYWPIDDPLLAELKKFTES